MFSNENFNYWSGVAVNVYTLNVHSGRIYRINLAPFFSLSQLLFTRSLVCIAIWRDLFFKRNIIWLPVPLSSTVSIGVARRNAHSGNKFSNECERTKEMRNVALDMCVRCTSANAAHWIVPVRACSHFKLELLIISSNYYSNSMIFAVRIANAQRSVEEHLLAQSRHTRIENIHVFIWDRIIVVCCAEHVMRDDKKLMSVKCRTDDEQIFDNQCFAPSHDVTQCWRGNCQRTNERKNI